MPRKSETINREYGLSRFCFKSIVRVSLIMLLFLMIGGSGPTNAQNHKITGKELKAQCGKPYSSRPTEAIQYAFCEGYITGVAATIKMFDGRLADRQRVCFPENIDAVHLTYVVHRFLLDNEHKLGAAGIGLVSEAFVKAFPCSE